MRKTKRAVLDAFSELVLERRYDEIQVTDILEDADVGRSTFYEHYRGKDDLLVQSMGGMLEILASAADEACDEAALARIVAHLWENRAMARHMLLGAPSHEVLPRLVRELAARVEVRLVVRSEARGEPALPLRLIAMQIAEAQFGLIKAWVAGEAHCDAERLAVGLRKSTSGCVSALWGA